MNPGLAVFILVIALDVGGLFLDLTLYLALGYGATITQMVRSGDWPIVGVAIVVLQIVGTAGLAYHFWGVE